MNEKNKYQYTPLQAPTPITEQQWPEGTLPLVSTRTYTYMHEPYIRECIESVLMQKTTFPVEVIIHDDASTDKTAGIVREYQAKHPHLIIAIYQVEKHYSKQVCATVMHKDTQKATRGKYIALCEGDDYWTDPLKLQKQADFMENNPGFSLCYHTYRLQTGDKKSKKIYPPEGKDYTADELIATPEGIATSTKFYINFNNPGIKLPSVWGDYTLNAFLGTLGHCKFLAYVDPSIYRLHSGGEWSAMNENAKHYSLISTKDVVYNFFAKQKDTHRMNISLEALKNAIVMHLPQVFPEYKKHNYASPHIKLIYKDMGIVIFYKPFLPPLKKLIKWIIGRK